MFRKRKYIITLVSLQPRINLSPFTKDFRGEEYHNESYEIFLPLLTWGKYFNEL